MGTSTSYTLIPFVGLLWCLPPTLIVAALQPLTGTLNIYQYYFGNIPANYYAAFNDRVATMSALPHNNALWTSSFVLVWEKISLDLIVSQ